MASGWAPAAETPEPAFQAIELGGGLLVRHELRETLEPLQDALATRQNAAALRRLRLAMLLQAPPRIEFDASKPGSDVIVADAGGNVAAQVKEPEQR
jgi:hypothetical protein